VTISRSSRFSDQPSFQIEWPANPAAQDDSANHPGSRNPEAFARCPGRRTPAHWRLTVTRAVSGFSGATTIGRRSGDNRLALWQLRQERRDARLDVGLGLEETRRGDGRNKVPVAYHLVSPCFSWLDPCRRFRKPVGQFRPRCALAREASLAWQTVFVPAEAGSRFFPRRFPSALRCGFVTDSGDKAPTHAPGNLTRRPSTSRRRRPERQADCASYNDQNSPAPCEPLSPLATMRDELPEPERDQT